MESDPIYSAIVYDFGNVLVEIDFARVLNRWAEHAKTDPRWLFERFHHGPAYQAHERDEIDAAGYFESLRREGLVMTDEQFADGWLAVFGEEIAPTVAAVKRLAPVVPQYLLSNTNRLHHAHFATRYAQALAPLRGQFLSYQMRLRKPERAAYDHVVREIGVEPGRILYFDDLEENVQAARAAGMDSVLVGSHDDVSRVVERHFGIAPPAP
jgi:putative hydrolase of the HAD superfamily